MEGSASASRNCCVCRRGRSLSLLQLKPRVSTALGGVRLRCPLLRQTRRRFARVENSAPLCFGKYRISLFTLMCSMCLFVFFSSCFGRPSAYGVIRPGIRSELPLRPLLRQYWFLELAMPGLGSNLCPGTAETATDPFAPQRELLI